MMILTDYNIQSVLFNSDCIGRPETIADTALNTLRYFLPLTSLGLVKFISNVSLRNKLSGSLSK